jgi:uncharacterized protein YicC (UPF0701 family)
MNKTIEQRAKEALEEIVNPIKFMRDRLKEGEQLNGMFAVQLSNDASHLKEIAQIALNDISSMSEREEWKRVEDVPQEWEIVIDKVLNWRNYRHEGLIEHLKERYTITPKPTP